MGQGSIERSPVPSNWTGSGHNGIRKTFQDMGPDAPLFTTLLAADQKRGDSRRQRLEQAAPKIPGVVFAFLLIGIAFALVYLSVASPRLSPMHITALVLAATVLFGAVFLIHSLDRPYSGPLAIEPVAMQDSADDDAEDFIDEYGRIRLRCDSEGNPTGSRS
jgi:amino acid transporter